MICIYSTRFDVEGAVLGVDNLDKNDACAWPAEDKTIEQYMETMFPSENPLRETRSARWPQKARYFKVQDRNGIDYIRAVWKE